MKTPNICIKEQIISMKKLDFESRCMINGGSKKVGTRRSYSSSGAAAAKKTLNKMNYFSHNIGLVAMTTSFAMHSISEIFREIFYDKEKVQKNLYHSSRYGGYKYYNRDYKSLIKPSLRFGAYPSRDSISFNLPWFY